MLVLLCLISLGTDRQGWTAGHRRGGVGYPMILQVYLCKGDTPVINLYLIQCSNHSNRFYHSSKIDLYLFNWKKLRLWKIASHAYPHLLNLWKYIAPSSHLLYAGKCCYILNNVHWYLYFIIPTEIWTRYCFEMYGIIWNKVDQALFTSICSKMWQLSCTSKWKFCYPESLEMS